MTKGCIIKGLMFTTVFLAIFFYVVTNKFDDWIVKPAKNYIYNSNFDDVTKQFTFIKNSEYKDSLLNIFQDYSKTFTEKKDFNLKNISDIAQELGNVIKDSVITKEDFLRIKQLITEDNTDERPKEK